MDYRRKILRFVCSFKHIHTQTHTLSDVTCFLYHLPLSALALVLVCAAGEVPQSRRLTLVFVKHAEY